MSKFFLFSRFNLRKPTRPQTKWYHALVLNYFSLNIILLIMVVILFITYIILVNNTTNDGFTYDSLEKQLAEIKEENKKLELQVYSLQSMEHIASLQDDFSLEPAQKDVDYLEIQPAAVALSE